MAKTELIILSLLFVISLSTSFTVINGWRYGTMVGGRTPVNDVKSNKAVQGLGRFVVEEYNRSNGRRWRSFTISSENGGGRSSSELVFSQVLEAEKQVVSGIKYYLKIDAMEDRLSRTFESVVVVKPWIHSKELLHFSPSTQ